LKFSGSSRRGISDPQGKTGLCSFAYPGSKPGAGPAASHRECTRCRIHCLKKRGLIFDANNGLIKPQHPKIRHDNAGSGIGDVIEGEYLGCAKPKSVFREPVAENRAAAHKLGRFGDNGAGGQRRVCSRIGPGIHDERIECSDLLTVTRVPDARGGLSGLCGRYPGHAIMPVGEKREAGLRI